MSDLKIKIQRLDSQLRQTHGSYDMKEKDYKELQGQRDEAVKERDTLITQIQEMEEKDQSKVIPWLVNNAFWDFYTSKNNFVVHNPFKFSEKKCILAGLSLQHYRPPGKAVHLDLPTQPLTVLKI